MSLFDIFMSREAKIRKEDGKIFNRLVDALGNDDKRIRHWEEKNLLFHALKAHFWDSATFMMDNGYRLEHPNFLNAPMEEKALPILWMDSPTFYSFLNAATPTFLNHQDKNGDTLLHAFDIFDHHMHLGRPDTVITHIISMINAGADTTIRNKNGDLPLKEITKRVGFVKNSSTREKYLHIIRQQRQHIKD